MGQKNTKTIDGGAETESPEVTFDDFEVLRAIGRGAFGKVFFHLQVLIPKILQKQNNPSTYVFNVSICTMFYWYHSRYA